MSLLGRLLPGSDTMLLRTLRGTEWSQLTDYVSPSFFEVLPARALWKQLRELGGNATDSAGFQLAQRTTEARMRELGCPVVIGRAAEGPTTELPALDEAARRARGQRMLEIFFGQLAGAPAALLDLRAACVESAADDYHWNPRALWVKWDPAFLASLREIYAGFYGEDDARFRAALVALEIDAAEDVFRDHLGAGDQSAVRFEAKTFQSTFHEVFVRCRDAGVRLHPNFLALGIYLGCLYDHLEALDLAFDVRGAYHTAAPGKDPV